MRRSGFVLADEDVSAPGPSVETGAGVPGQREVNFPTRTWNVRTCNRKRGVRAAPTEPYPLNETRFPGLSQAAPLGLGFWSSVCAGYSVSFLG